MSESVNHTQGMDYSINYSPGHTFTTYTVFQLINYRMCNNKYMCSQQAAASATVARSNKFKHALFTQLNSKSPCMKKNMLSCIGPSTLESAFPQGTYTPLHSVNHVHRRQECITNTQLHSLKRFIVNYS